MEYITPEEIARVVIHEIRGANTGQDCISAMDGSVLNPSYKAGLLRNAALNDLSRIQEESGVPSIALGRLGPPELSKLLFEAHLFKHAYGSMSSVLQISGVDLAQRLAAVLQPAGVAESAPSIGILLLPDGRRSFEASMCRKCGSFDLGGYDGSRECGEMGQ